MPERRVPASDEVKLLSGSARAEVKRLHAAVLAFYVLDALLLTGYGLAGTVSLRLGWLYGLVGCALSGALLCWFWWRRGREADLDASTLWQTVMAAVVMLATLGFAPQLGALMLMNIMAVLMLSAVQLKRGQLLGLCLLLPAIGVSILAWTGGTATLPTANLVERLLTGVWLSWLLVKASAHNLASARLRRLVHEANDRLAQALKALEKIASTDELTALPNRRSILAHLDLALQPGHRPADGRTGVALMDIDEFKAVNDRHGHGIGDQVLRLFGQLAVHGLRPTDRVGRYGGEEFLLVMTQMPDASAAAEAAERLRVMVQAHDWSAVAPGLAVTVSAGVALVQPDEDASSAIRRADAALYVAKQAGRNRVENALAGRMHPTTSELAP